MTKRAPTMSDIPTDGIPCPHCGKVNSPERWIDRSIERLEIQLGKLPPRGALDAQMRSYLKRLIVMLEHQRNFRICRFEQYEYPSKIVNFRLGCGFFWDRRNYV